METYHAPLFVVALEQSVAEEAYLVKTKRVSRCELPHSIELSEV
jgi:hypothetical protein